MAKKRSKSKGGNADDLMRLLAERMQDGADD